MGVQPFLIASSLVGVLAQRLVQTLCIECKVPHTPDEAELEAIDLKEVPPETTLFKATGCPKCNFRGYAGRTSIGELLVITDEIRPLILSKADSNQVKKMAVSQGMIPLRQAAINKVLDGVTSIEEMMRVVNEDEEEVLDV